MNHASIAMEQWISVEDRAGGLSSIDQACNTMYVYLSASLGGRLEQVDIPGSEVLLGVAAIAEEAIKGASGWTF